MARPLLPPALYTIMGNAMGRSEAKRNNVLQALESRPFALPVVESTTR